MLWVDKETVAICKDEWSILLAEDGKPYQDEFKSNIKYVTSNYQILGVGRWHPAQINVIIT